MSKTNLYNTPYEVGARVLILLNYSVIPIDLQRIIYYDYLVLHYGDIDKNYESLHPSNPYHITELYVRRKFIQEALDLISRKGLIDITLSKHGFLYSSNKMGRKFIKCFDSDYFSKLEKFAQLVIDFFKDFSGSEIDAYISNNIGKWKDEFETESLFRGKDNE